MTGPVRLSDASLRDAVRKRVDETSLREVADEVGMSFSGLRSFLEGGRPHRRTLDKLVHWYYSKSKRLPATPPEELELALALVRNYLRDQSKPRAVRERRRRDVIDRLTEDPD